MKEMLSQRLDEHMDVFLKLKNDSVFSLQVEKASELILQSIRKGNAIYLCGNGGSAADSQHIAAEFVSRFYKDRRGLNAEALTVNTSILTAIGNDFDFERIFVRQLEAKAHSGDVLVGISTSGRSGNVLAAFDYARMNGIHTIFMTGKNYANDEKGCDCVISVPSDDTPRIQEAHIFIGHLIAEYVEAAIIAGGD